MSLSSDLKRFAEKSNRKIEAVGKAAFFEVGNRTINGTPVKTGILKNSWMSETGNINPSIRNVAGSESTQELKATIESWTMTDKELYFTNAQPYAYRIEYEGYSAKAPEGMLEKNILSWNAIVKKWVRHYSD